jgi:hypothetical protein
MICRIKRGMAPYILVLLQVHLLWIVMFHRHGETPAPWHTDSVQVGGTQQSPAAESTLVCTACQIVRNSAIRPATAAPLFSAALAVALSPRSAISQYHSLLPVIWYGRAPPIF